ncbi:MAG: hypothetical protein IJX81_06205 [Clostridia bacterium]|nr:hypothetical protein [Clostridia bacterium]
MEQQAIYAEELTFMDVLRILFKKIKLILIVFLCSIFVGGALGALLNFNKKYYGTEIQFYINPKEKDASDNDAESTYGVYGSYGDNVMETMIKLLESNLFTEQLIAGWDRTPEKYLENGSINPAYKEFIYALEDVITYSYSSSETESTVITTNLAKSFIVIEIKILAQGEEMVEFAEELLTRLRVEVPKYVTDHMIVPSGFVGTNCEEITTISEIELLNEGNTLVAAVKYALIFGAVGLIVVCAVAIITERVKATSNVAQTKKKEGTEQEAA